MGCGASRAKVDEGARERYEVSVEGKNATPSPPADARSESTTREAEEEEVALELEDIEDDYPNSNDTPSREQQRLQVWSSAPSSPISSTRSSPTSRRAHAAYKARVSYDLQGKKIINGYKVLKEVGEGRYGIVYLVENEEREKFAMKACWRKLLATDKAGRIKELAILQHLEHPNIIQLTAFIDDPDQNELYMMFEYVDGGPVMSLNDKGRATTPCLTEEQARVAMVQSVAGLEYLHSCNIVHRDIKPENILVTRDGVYKIADFGVSHFFDSENDTIRKTRGTPHFMAPEMCTGEAFSGKACDVWALGVTLYVLLYGVVPFAKENMFQLMAAIENDPVVFPSYPSLTPACQALISRLLEKNLLLRITLSEVKDHVWLTRSNKAINSDECARIREQRKQLERLEVSPKRMHIPPESPTVPGKRDLNILIVEDVFLARELVEKMFRSILLEANQIITIDAVNDGDEAIEACKKKQYFLCVMDVHMTRVSGFEATVQIRQYELENSLPQVCIVGLTADQHASINDLCGEAGMDCVVLKPITPSKLRSICQQYGLEVKDKGCSLDTVWVKGNKPHAFTVSYKKFLQDIGEADTTTRRSSVSIDYNDFVTPPNAVLDRVSSESPSRRDDSSLARVTSHYQVPDMISGGSGRSLLVAKGGSIVSAVDSNTSTVKYTFEEEGMSFYVGGPQHSLQPALLAESGVSSMGSVLNDSSKSQSENSFTSSISSTKTLVSDPKGIRERSMRCSMRMSQLYRKAPQLHFNDLVSIEEAPRVGMLLGMKALIDLTDHDTSITVREVQMVAKAVWEYVNSKRFRQQRQAIEGKIQRTELANKLKSVVDPIAKRIHQDMELFHSDNPNVYRAQRSFECYGHTEAGKRKSNEDTYCLILYPSILFHYDKGQQRVREDTEDQQEYYMAVLDGHGGFEAAEFCSLHLAPNIFRSPHYPLNVVEAILDGYRQTDQEFVSRAESTNSDSGTTVLLAVLRGNTVWVGNAGDSQAVLCTSGKAVALNRIHVCADEEERKLIENRGGMVVHMNGGWRVNGMLLVSRSLGDRPCREHMLPDPEVVEHHIDSELDEFLILASDGLWDVMSHQEAVDFVRQARAEIDANRIQETVTEPAYDDNISVVESIHSPSVASRRTSVASFSSYRVSLMRKVIDESGAGEMSPRGGGKPEQQVVIYNPTRGSVVGMRALREAVRDSFKHAKQLTGTDSEGRWDWLPPLRPPFPFPSHSSATGQDELRELQDLQEREEEAEERKQKQRERRGSKSAKGEASEPLQDALDLIENEEEEEDAEEQFDDYEIIVEALTAEAIDRGSKDNVTVVIMFFRGCSYQPGEAIEIDDPAE